MCSCIIRASEADTHSTYWTPQDLITSHRDYYIWFDLNTAY